MYRSRRTTTRNSIGSNDSSNLSANDSLGKENASPQSNSKKVVGDDSITEIFQKLSLRANTSLDRKNHLFPNNTSSNSFMTSSPIQNRSKLEKPIFIKKEPMFPKNDGIVTSDVEAGIETLPLNKNIKSAHIDNNNDTASPMGLSEKPPSGRNIKPEIKSETVQVLKSKTKGYPSYTGSSLSLAKKKATVPQAFSFENKDKSIAEKRKELVLQDLLEKKRLASAFRANPVPSTELLCGEKNIKTTKLCDQRVKLLQAKSEAKISFESSLNSNNTSCHSRSKGTSYLQRSPFKPEKSVLKSTIAQSPRFTLSSRIDRWKEMEAARKAEEEMIEKIKRDLEEEKLERERAEVKEIRKATIIRANSIQRFKKLEILHNPKTTVPHTPKFSDRLKK